MDTLLWVLRIIMIAFGCFEIITNIIYLFIDKNGLEKAYNQHKEIPPSVSKATMKKKCQTMLLWGIVFVTGFSLTFTFTDVNQWIVFGVFLGYMLYTWGESAYYKSHKMAYTLALLITVLTTLSLLVIVL